MILSDSSSKWDGPYSFLPNQNVPWMYDSATSAQRGIYLWTINIQKEIRVNYVGMSGSSMLSRQQEHLRMFLTGHYSIYDSAKLQIGEKKPALCGSKGMQKFLKSYDESSKLIFSQLKIMNVHFAAFPETETLTLKRIESTLITKLRETEDTREFLDNPRLSIKLDESKKDIDVRITQLNSFRGLPEDITA
jgi:hypothetical protein